MKDEIYEEYEIEDLYDLLKPKLKSNTCYIIAVVVVMILSLSFLYLFFTI